MKKQIEEVQNYFLNKITACDFTLISIEETHDGWIWLYVEIEGFKFKFALHPDLKLHTWMRLDCFMNMPSLKGRTSNLFAYIKDHKERIRQTEIEKAKARIKELENNF